MPKLYSYIIVSGSFSIGGCNRGVHASISWNCMLVVVRKNYRGSS